MLLQLPSTPRRDAPEGHARAYPSAGDRSSRRDDAPVERGESAEPVDQLLDDSWTAREAPFSTRQRAAGAGLTAAFVVAALALLLLAAPTATHGSPFMVAALVLAFAVASRVEFPMGAGYAVPTQLFLVPLFILASAPLVPLLVLAAQTAATLAEIAWRRVPADRLVDVGVDSWHALAPALVLTLAASPDPARAAPWVFAAAFAAQITSEVATSSLRVRLGLGISPRVQLRVLLTVWAIDLLLSPVAWVAAVAAALHGLTIAPLSLIGFTVLLALLTNDRTARIDQAHERLEALREERTRLEVAVQRIGDAFASKLDLDALLDITMRASIEALDAEAGRASAHPGPGRKLVRRATHHEDPRLAIAIQAAERAAAETGELAVVAVDGGHAIACPLRAPDASGTAGVIVIARHGRPFAERKLDLLRYLCEQAGKGADDIARHATLQGQALSDELTGLANHRRLQEVLALGAASHEVSGAPLGLILFDLDNFKTVNDTRGHQTGDHVLRSVAQVLRSVCRTGDEAARYGGEELAIVMHAAEESAVLAVAERARAAIAALELVCTEGRDLRVTTSVGVAMLGPGAPDPQSLIAAADAALYEAKDAGKNTVRSAGRSSAAAA